MLKNALVIIGAVTAAAGGDLEDIVTGIKPPEAPSG